jgi:hypothetical protein
MVRASHFSIYYSGFTFGAGGSKHLKRGPFQNRQKICCGPHHLPRLPRACASRPEGLRNLLLPRLTRRRLFYIICMLSCCQTHLCHRAGRLPPANVYLCFDGTVHAVQPPLLLMMMRALLMSSFLHLLLSCQVLMQLLPPQFCRRHPVRVQG